MKPRATLPPPSPTLPSPTGIDPANPESVRGFLVALTSAVQQHLAERPSAQSAQESRLFLSPNGTVYTVSVADDGTLAATPLGSVQGEPLP